MNIKNFRLRDSAGKWAIKDLPERKQNREKDVEFVILRANSAFFDDLLNGRRSDDQVLIVPPRKNS